MPGFDDELGGMPPLPQLMTMKQRADWHRSAASRAYLNSQHLADEAKLNSLRSREWNDAMLMHEAAAKVYDSMAEGVPNGTV